MFLRHFLIYFLARGLTGVLNFSALAIYTRFLPPADYAVYSLVLAAISLCIAVGFAWLTECISRFASGSSPRGVSLLLSNIAVIYALGMLAVISVAVAVYHINLFPKIPHVIVLIATTLILLEVSYEASLAFFRARLKVIRYAILAISRSTLAIIFGSTALALGYGYPGVLVGTMVAFLISTLLFIPKKRIWNTLSARFISSEELKMIIRYGLPLVAVMAIQAAIAATDRFLLISLTDADITGQYAVAQDFVSKLFVFLMMIVFRAGYPLIVHKFENQGVDAARHQIKTNLLFLLGLSLPGVVGMAVLAPSLVNVFLGEAYRVMSAELIPYLVIAVFLNTMVQFHLVIGFRLLKSTQLTILPVLVSLLINGIVGYCGIMAVGVYGAVIGSLAAQAYYFFAVLWRTRRTFWLPFPAGDALKIACSALIMGVIIYGFRGEGGWLTLVGTICLGACTYALLLIVFNVADLQRTLLRSPWQRWLRKR